MYVNSTTSTQPKPKPKPEYQNLPTLSKLATVDSLFTHILSSPVNVFIE